MPCCNLLLVIVLLCSCIGRVASSQYNKEARNNVFNWLLRQPGFYFNPKLKWQANDVIVEKQIDTFEVLMVIPSSAVLAMKDYDERDDALCELFQTLWYEIGLGEGSNYAPYLHQIQQVQADDTMMPALWSNIGKRLFDIVKVETFRLDLHSAWTMSPEEITSWIEDYEYCFDQLHDEEKSQGDDQLYEEDDEEEDDEEEDDEEEDDGEDDGEDEEEEDDEEEDDDDEEEDDEEEEENEKLHRRLLALTAQHQVDQRFFVPLYDQLGHHHMKQNVQHIIQDDHSVTVVALTTIASRETLYRPTQACLWDCEKPQEHTMIDALRTFGNVQNYPHHWHFPFGVSFVFDGSSKRAAKGTNGHDVSPALTWIHRPVDVWQLHLMAEEYERQVNLYASEIYLSRDSVPTNEWKVIASYSEALRNALEFSFHEGWVALGRELENPLSQKENEKENRDNGKEEDDEEDEDEDSKQEVDDNIIDHTTEETCVVQQYTNLEASTTKSAGTDPLDIDCSTHCDIPDIEISRGCKNHTYNTIHNQTAWAHMRAAYVAIVGSNDATLNVTNGSGMKVPFKIGHSPGRGRGVFATEDIRKGTLVWHGENTAAFTARVQFRKFLASLPDVLACDLIIWCFTFIDGNMAFIGCDLDEASLFNSYDNGAEYNIRHVRHFRGLKYAEYALRDITAGEELIASYDELGSIINSME
jgi:hypothetical protein